MSVTTLQRPALANEAVPAPRPATQDSAPVALVHLPLAADSDLQPAATAIYRAARQGRRVVAVAGGSASRADALADICRAIGLEVARSQPHGPALVHEPVVIVEGVAVPRAPVAARDRPLRIALAGCGVVGGGLIDRIGADPRVELVSVLVRNPTRTRHPSVDPTVLVTEPAALLASRPDILIDALSDAATGLALTRAALAQGVHVVSAAKQAIGPDLTVLQALAQATGATLSFSAAVGGGAPVIETLQRALAHSPVVRIEGVLNGTVNFLLNQLSGGQAFDAALAEARAHGFAEEDPSSDLEGHDAAAKIAILSTLAFGRAPKVSRDNLSATTQLPGGPVRQIARTDGATASVAFERVADPLFTNLPDEWNALKVTCADGRVFTCRGRGAGRAPTAESVWADVLDIVEAAKG